MKHETRKSKAIRKKDIDWKLGREKRIVREREREIERVLLLLVYRVRRESVVTPQRSDLKQEF